MQLQEVLTNLAYGPIAHLAIGGKETGAIPDAYNPRVTHHINNGLKRLYSRFLIKESELVIRASSGRTEYPLRPEYAMSSEGTGDKFILDSLARPYRGDYLRTLGVKDDNGNDIELNIEGVEDGVFEPERGVLLIPNPAHGDYYFVNYQASHLKVDHATLDQEIHLPDELFNALEAFVASEIFGSIPGPENVSMSQKLINEFETICLNTITYGTVRTHQTIQNQRLQERGFV